MTEVNKIINLINQHLVIWPENVDSKLWNERLEHLLADIEPFNNKQLELLVVELNN